MRTGEVLPSRIAGNTAAAGAPKIRLITPSLSTSLVLIYNLLLSVLLFLLFKFYCLPASHSLLPFRREDMSITGKDLTEMVYSGGKKSGISVMV